MSKNAYSKAGFSLNTQVIMKALFANNINFSILLNRFMVVVILKCATRSLFCRYAFQIFIHKFLVNLWTVCISPQKLARLLGVLVKLTKKCEWKRTAIPHYLLIYCTNKYWYNKPSWSWHDCTVHSHYTETFLLFCSVWIVFWYQCQVFLWSPGVLLLTGLSGWTSLHCYRNLIMLLLSTWPGWQRLSESLG